MTALRTIFHTDSLTRSLVGLIIPNFDHLFAVICLNFNELRAAWRCYEADTLITIMRSETSLTHCYESKGVLR